MFCSYLFFPVKVKPLLCCLVYNSGRRGSSCYVGPINLSQSCWEKNAFLVLVSKYMTAPDQSVNQDQQYDGTMLYPSLGVLGLVILILNDDDKRDQPPDVNKSSRIAYQQARPYRDWNVTKCLHQRTKATVSPLYGNPLQ